MSCHSWNLKAQILADLVIPAEDGEGEEESEGEEDENEVGLDYLNKDLVRDMVLHE